MKWNLTKDKLPEEYRLVIIYIPNRPWIWCGKGDIHYKIAWLVKPKSKKFPYCWIEFGPDAYRLEEVKAWTYFDEFTEKRGK